MPETPKKLFSGPSLVRFFFLSLTSMLLFCLGFFVPMLGMAASLASPAPIALLGARENKALMTLGLLSVTFTLWLVFGWAFALSFLLGYGLLSFGLTLPLGRLEKGSESLLFCVVVSVVSKVLFIAVSVMLTGSNPFEIDPNASRAMFNDVISEGGQMMTYFREYADQVMEIVPYLTPSTVMVYSMFESFLNYKLCETIQRRRDGEAQFSPLPPFGEWRFPSSLVYALVFAFAMPFLSKGGGRLWIMLNYNLKFMLNIFFFIQGISLVWWLFSKYAARRRFPLPLRIVLIGFLSPMLSTWLAALGLGDMCFDFRTKKIRRA